jgi:hypothetical protein
MESLTLEQWSYIGDIISGFVVAITLVFLVYEMAKNGRRLKSEAFREAVNDFVHSYTQATETKEKASTFRNALNHFDELSSDEQASFHSTMLQITATLSHVHSLFMKGLLEEPVFTACERSYLPLMNTDGGQQWWQKFKHVPPQPFTEYVTKAIDKLNTEKKSELEELPWLKADA